MFACYDTKCYEPKNDKKPINTLLEGKSPFTMNIMYETRGDEPCA